MPLGSHHNIQAENNLKFLKSFYGSYKYNDWAITVSFYTALHIVEAAIYSIKKFNIQNKIITIEGVEDAKRELITNGIIKPTYHVDNHRIRTIIIQYGFPDVENQYKQLLNMALSARYTRFSWSKIIPVTVYLIPELFTPRYTQGYPGRRVQISKRFERPALRVNLPQF